MSQQVKLLGDTSYGLTEDMGVTAQQSGGLGKMSYGLAKITQYGLTKLSQYTPADDISFAKADKFGSDTLSYQKKARGGIRRSPQKRQVSPLQKARLRAKIARRAKANKRKRFSYRIGMNMPHDQFPNAQFSNGIKGLSKSAQPPGGITKPRTRVRTGNIAKTREQFLKSSYQITNNVGKALLKIFNI